MKTYFYPDKLDYDGSQLRTQFAYFQFGLMGDSAVSFCGSCDVDLEHMADGEDLLSQSVIRGDQMLHFIVEIYHERLSFGVAFQRLVTAIVKDSIENQAKVSLSRSGDDLYWDNKKLSISVAAQSPLSVVIHYALNITNDNTPVATCALSDFGIDPKSFAQQVLEKIKSEFETIREATYKVKPL